MNLVVHTVDDGLGGTADVSTATDNDGRHPRGIATALSAPGRGRELSQQRWKGEMLQVMMQLQPGLNNGCDGLAAPPIDPRAPTSTVYALDRPRLQYQPMGNCGEHCRHDRKGGYCRGCSCRSATLTVPVAANRGLRYGCGGTGLTTEVCTVRCPIGL